MTALQKINNMNNWIKTNYILPPENEIVETKIHDKQGIRDECDLFRLKNMFFTTDAKMYVYYTPTHWRKKSQ